MDPPQDPDPIINPSFVSTEIQQGLPMPQPEQTISADLQPPPYTLADPNPETKAKCEQGSFTPYPTPPSTFPVAPYPGYYNNLPAGITTATPGVRPGSTVVIHSTGYGEVPVVATCQHCNQIVTTTPQYVSGSCTWLACCITCLFCPLFCWLIPFCMAGCKDVYHYCPNCNNVMGVCKRM